MNKADYWLPGAATEGGKISEKWCQATFWMAILDFDGGYMGDTVVKAHQDVF